MGGRAQYGFRDALNIHTTHGPESEHPHYVLSRTGMEHCWRWGSLSIRGTFTGPAIADQDGARLCKFPATPDGPVRKDTDRS